MSLQRLSLASLKAAHEKLFGKEASSAESTPQAEQATESEEQADEADSEEADSEEEADADPKEEKPKPDAKKEAAQPKGTFLSDEDYGVITDLASEAVALRAENQVLKAKADRWDAYQAALKGIKPGADTAGASSQADEAEGKDPYAALRAKYPNLMKDL